MTSEVVGAKGQATESEHAREDAEFALRLTQVRKSFGAVKALKGVTLEVRPGTVHAVVGENGAGKSTLMAIATGELAVDEGTVEICGVACHSASQARKLGIALVHQHPALLPDLTVAENLRVAMPPDKRPSWRASRAWAGRAISDWREGEVSPKALAEDLPSDAQSIVEISKAIVQNPRVLVLDEPTEHTSAKDLPFLFASIRDFVKRGAAVIYISHRIAEVKEIADEITVLRDGEVRATFAAEEVSERQIVDLIAGRPIDTVFPAKNLGAAENPVVLEVEGLSGDGFSDVSFQIRAGEIVGLAGIEGNGQREILRALAGLEKSSGAVSVRGRRVSVGTPVASRRNGFAYIPRDRQAEAVLTSLSVRENLSVGRLLEFTRLGFVDRRAERRDAQEHVERFRIKTAGVRAPIQSLSGGNQQKVVVARSLGEDRSVVLADDATQGVDVGSRMEIFGFLRQSAQADSAVLYVSSDFRELAGLCDRVLVVSRGRIVAELSGEQVAEPVIVERVLTASGTRERAEAKGRRSPIGKLLKGNSGPAIILGVAIVVLGVIGASASPYFLSAMNLQGILTLFAALAFAAMGQQVVMLVGGIDLSIGPLMGFLVVLASFVLQNRFVSWQLWIGLGVLVGAALGVGLINWILAVPLRVPSMIATLVTFTALQGVSLLLRPLPAGQINTDLIRQISTKIGPVPIMAIVAVVLAIVLDLVLARTVIGTRLRAVGSSLGVARRVGINTPITLLVAFLGASALTVFGGLMLIAQIRVGDPTAGVDYTLLSITAVVLGGASIFGGRGSMINAMLGAFLILEVNALAGFLNLDTAWQQWLLGGLTLLAVGAYSALRSPSEFLQRLRRPRPALLTEGAGS